MSSSKQAVVHTADSFASADGEVRRARQGASIFALPLRICVVLVFVWASYFAVRRGVAAWLFSKNDPHDVELAMRWDPQNPEYPAALAHLVQFYSEDPDPNRSIELCERAVRLSPNDAHYWADLGSAYDRAGRANDAIRAFETARRLFANSPDINWRLANFYIRARRAKDALPLLKSVLGTGGIEDREAFSLVSSAGVDARDVLGQMIPARTTLFVDYLNFEIESGDVSAADEAWQALLKTGLQFRTGDAFPYIDFLLRNRQLDAATNAWREVAKRFPTEVLPRISPDNLVTNGDFDYPILDGGFDWRVVPVQGATVRIDTADKARPSGLLRIDFDGSQNPEYGAVFEFVRVRPNKRYEFSAEMRAQGITTDSGPRFQVFDDYDMAKLSVSTPNETGSVEWRDVELRFQTGPQTHLLIVRILRPASTKFDNKLAGTLWVRHVALREREGR